MNPVQGRSTPEGFSHLHERFCQVIHYRLERFMILVWTICLVQGLKFFDVSYPLDRDAIPND
jgi:hypothetical protein